MAKATCMKSPAIFGRIFGRSRSILQSPCKNPTMLPLCTGAGKEAIGERVCLPRTGREVIATDGWLSLGGGFFRRSSLRFPSTIRANLLQPAGGVALRVSINAKVCLCFEDHFSTMSDHNWSARPLFLGQREELRRQFAHIIAVESLNHVCAPGRPDGSSIRRPRQRGEHAKADGSEQT